MCPPAWSSPAQIPRARSASRGWGTPREPSLSAQALLLLLSKTLAFLEIKVSAAEELVRPVYALRNQARAKLEGTDAMGTCWPASQLLEARLHDTQFCLPCSGPAPRGHGVASQEGQRGPVQLRRRHWGPMHASVLQTSGHLHPLCSRAQRGSVTPGTPTSVLSGLWPHRHGSGWTLAAKGEGRASAGHQWRLQGIGFCLSRCLHSLAGSWPLSFH